MSSSHFLSHSAPLFEKYTLLNVNRSLYFYVKKNSTINSLISFTSTLTSKKKKKKNLHRYQTRHAEDYEIPHFKTNFARKTIRATGPTKRNSTEKHIKEAKTIKHFRNKIKKKKKIHIKHSYLSIFAPCPKGRWLHEQN